MRTHALRLLQRLRSGAALEALQTNASTCKAVASSVETNSSVRCFHAIRSLSAQPVLWQQPMLMLAPAQELGRGISSSAFSLVDPLTEVAVEGEVEPLLRAIENVVAGDTATAKDVADAAVSLAYLQAKGARRAWGRVFERASAVKDSFDAASLSSFLWAATTANVDHFKTVYELGGAVHRLLKQLTPTQLSIVVEALGKAHVKDADLFNKISDQVTANVGAFKGPELARLLWGFGAAAAEDAKIAKAIGAALESKAGELAPREATQAIWGLAKLRRADKSVLDVLVRAAKPASGKLESPIDAAGLAWSLGFLTYKPDNDTLKALSSALKAGATELAPAHAIDAAWGLALLGDRDAVPALFAHAAAAIDKAPETFDVYQLGALFQASVMVPDAKLPEKVASYTNKMYNLGAEHHSLKLSGAVKAFHAELAEAVARSTGARYRPEIAAAIKSFAKTTPDGIAVEIGVDVDKDNKVAFDAVGSHMLTSSAPHVLLGPAVARAKVLEARGYKVVSVPHSTWAQLGDIKAKAAWLLKLARSAMPSAASKIDALQKKLDEPFDPYAE